MMRPQLKTAMQHWRYVAPVVAYPKNDKQLNVLISELDTLLEIVGKNEKHPLIGLVDVMSHVIASYEEERFKDAQPKVKGVDALKFFMEAHDLKQSDLQDIGSQGVVSEILTGKRQLNVRQIRLLADRFHVDVSTFIDD
jgi:HTH-type transcriptional regulator/antitoxin HigA